MNEPRPVAPGRIARLAEEIREASRGRATLVIGKASAEDWSGAIDALTMSGQFAAAYHGAQELSAANPSLLFPKFLQEILRNLPAIGPDFVPFTDQTSSDVQVVRRPGADTTILVFCDFFHRAMAALSVVHQWLGNRPVNVVYLRDLRRLYYLDGIPSLGTGREAAVANLKVIVASLNTKRLLCLASGEGSFAGLQYGLELGAEAVACLAGRYDLANAAADETFIFSKGFRQHPAARSIPNIHRLYAQADKPPRALLIYGDRFRPDALEAQYLAGLPSVTLAPIPNWQSHLIFTALVRAGGIDGVIDWLLTGVIPKLEFANQAMANGAMGRVRVAQ